MSILFDSVLFVTGPYSSLKECRINNKMNFEPKICQKNPYVKLELPGHIKAWCSCGLSLRQPFCDRNHYRGMTGKEPVVIKIEKKGLYSWCGCKRTATPPFCDGHHESIK